MPGFMSVIADYLAIVWGIMSQILPIAQTALWVYNVLRGALSILSGD